MAYALRSVMAPAVLLGAFIIPAHSAVISGRTQEMGPDGRIIVNDIDPFGLDTEETAAADPRPDAEVIRDAFGLLPKLGCIGELASIHLADLKSLVRFGRVDIADRHGETVRGQVRAPERGSSHLAIVIDSERPYLHNPKNAARIIAHEFVHDLQFHAGMIEPKEGALAFKRDAHDPAAAEEAMQAFAQRNGLPATCRVGNAAKAAAVLERVNALLAGGREADLSAARAELDKVIEERNLPAFQHCLEARRAVLEVQIGRFDGRSDTYHALLQRVSEAAPSSPCHANVQGLALALEGDRYVQQRWPIASRKAYRQSLERATDSELIAYVHRRLAIELFSMYGSNDNAEA